MHDLSINFIAIINLFRHLRHLFSFIVFCVTKLCPSPFIDTFVMSTVIVYFESIASSYVTLDKNDDDDDHHQTEIDHPSSRDHRLTQLKC